MRTYSNRHADLVPNDKIREAVRASGMTVEDIARAVGRDSAQIRRSLGLGNRMNRGRWYPPQQRINYHLAVAIVRALPGVDPVDVDL